MERIHVQKRYRRQIGRPIANSPSSATPNHGRSPALQDSHRTRIKVFESLLELYPDDAKQPSSDLVDMVDWYEQNVPK